MSREDVARNQRARIYGAMIEAVHEYGYEQTTVKQVVALAGVSGGAFYKQFANKEAAFLATYDIVVARARKLVRDAWGSERGWKNRLRVAVKALLDDVAEQPKGPSLVLVDSLGIGPKGRERMVLASATFERVVALAYQADPGGEPLSPPTVRAIVAGIRHVAFTRINEHREAELSGLADELLAWIESYRSPLAKRLNASELGPPRRAEPRPAAFLAAADRRSRALAALVQLTLDERYAELSDPQIAQFAGISTEAFHEFFDNKEACFLAVLDEFAAETMLEVRRAIESASSWAETVCLAVSALADHFASHEALARIAFVEIFDVGPGMIGRLTRSIEEFVKLLDGLGPEVRSGPLVAREAITGAIWGIVSACAARDKMADVTALVDQLTFLVLAPYLGAESAVEAIEAMRKSLLSQ